MNYIFNIIRTIINIENIVYYNKNLFIGVIIFFLFIIYIMYNILAYYYILNHQFSHITINKGKKEKIKGKIKEKIKEKTFLNNDDCPICLDKLNLNNNKVYYICNNNHYFHQKCLEKWLDKKHICPICRESL